MIKRLLLCSDPSNLLNRLRTTTFQSFTWVGRVRQGLEIKSDGDVISYVFLFQYFLCLRIRGGSLTPRGPHTSSVPRRDLSTRPKVFSELPKTPLHSGLLTFGGETTIEEPESGQCLKGVLPGKETSDVLTPFQTSLLPKRGDVHNSGHPSSLVLSLQFVTEIDPRLF